MHKCEECGANCGCDDDDVMGAAPPWCRHWQVCAPDSDDGNDEGEELDDNGRPLDWNDDDGDVMSQPRCP
jgi:hypothetical protein